MVDGIYIHIPFCLNKCNYCDFLSFKSDKESRKKYVDYLLKEIDLYPPYKYNTVYFGGGTPSLLDLEDIERILEKLDIKEGAEVTLEVNPKTVDYDKLVQLKKIGINRLSIGIQSFDEKYLRILGRMHSSEEGIETYYNARKAGFENISLDLMFSLPGQSIKEVENDLKKLLNMKPEHFSIYSLIWEEGTVFFEKLKKGLLRETENEIEADMFEKIIDTAEEAGYIHYEISNFSLPEKEAVHNTKYWENKEYLGIGLGASGYINDMRYKNQMKFLEYYDSIESRIKPVAEKEKITLKEKEEYKYILGFRLLKKGVKPEGEYIEKCISLEKRGYLTKNGEYFILTRKGLMVANDVIEEFV
ncbi:radical SAM family heme chaperone HemW [Fusobacterium varium]